MFGFNFGEQIHRCLRIDRIVKPGYRLPGCHIDGPVDIQTLTSAIGFQCFFLPLLDPAVGRNAVVLRMRRVAK